MKVVPAGKVLLAKVMSKESVLFPLLVTGLLKVTVAPWEALATVSPTMSTAAAAWTTKGTWLDVPVTTVPEPSS